jgi:PAS domain S-box-containing protein
VDPRGADAPPYPRAELESLLAAIVESSDDAIIAKDLNGIVTSWNKGAERIFGYTAVEMIGQPIALLAPPDQQNEMPAILNRIKGGERVDHYETVRLAKDGRRLHISLTVSPIHDNNGRIIGASKIARDITERKLAEETLTRQAGRLARANADLQQFAYITSHDLQEPLRTVLACTEMFLSNNGSALADDQRLWLDLSVEAARRMTGMIKDLLTYAQSVNEELPMEALRTADLLEWVIKDLHVAIESNRAQIVYECRQMPIVHGNKIALVQLFQNLIGNALKYRGPEPPRIEITVEPGNAKWLFAVRDNGIGIAPAYHERIFILFQRLYNREYPGTGIGLALCRKIIQTHGGEIWVESEVGQGATFKFTLPAKEVE